MARPPKYPASERLRRLGLKRQADLAVASGKTQGWLSHQLNGRRGFSPDLEIALRLFLLGAGLDPITIEQEVADLRELAGSQG